MARNPFVSVAVPSPMARDPNVSTTWWWTGRFVNVSRRGDASQLVFSLAQSFRVKKVRRKERALPARSVKTRDSLF